MNNIFDWNKYDDEVKSEILKKIKSGSIAFLKEKKELINWEIYHAYWEDYLSSSDYWKNWQEKINSFETEKEVNFYTDRLWTFIEFVKNHTRKDIRFVENAKQWDPLNTPKLIEQELKRLENISQEDFKKEDKFADVEFKELSIKEMLNDPWFNKEIDNVFGLENRKLPREEEKPVEKNGDNNIYYQTWTKNQLISEINRLKAENKELKNNKNLTTSENQERLQQNQQKLEQIKSFFDSKDTQQLTNNPNNNFPAGWIISGGILVIIGLTALFIVRNKKKRKRL
jgi:hypothetical protein